MELFRWYSAIFITTLSPLFPLALGNINRENNQVILDKYECSHSSYNIHLFSLDPLVIYIDGFLTAAERQRLLSTSSSTFISSLTADQTGAETLRSTRRSKSANAKRDAITRCIEARALDFQGFDLSESHLEPIQLVKYAVNETYDFHTDWFTSPAQTTEEYGGNRLSSFFAYVYASDDITGGGTTFPLLDVPKDERWCKFVDCDVPMDEGVTFLPIPGNAVYWVNLLKGHGDPRNLHRGDVVTSGEKIGMNIWTRERPLSPKYSETRNEDE